MHTSPKWHHPHASKRTPKTFEWWSCVIIISPGLGPSWDDYHGWSIFLFCLQSELIVSLSSPSDHTPQNGVWGVVKSEASEQVSTSVGFVLALTHRSRTDCIRKCSVCLGWEKGRGCVPVEPDLDWISQFGFVLKPQAFFFIYQRWISKQAFKKQQTLCGVCRICMCLWRFRPSFPPTVQKVCCKL